MASSSSNSTRSALKCRCGATMVLRTSTTEANPNRDFWKCQNVKDGKICKGFFWDDEVTGNARVHEHKDASTMRYPDESMDKAHVDNHYYLARIVEKMNKLDKLDKLDNLEKLDKLDKLYEMLSSRRDIQTRPSCCSIL